MLLAYVVAPLVVVFGLVGLAALRQFERLSEQRMQEEIELVARAIHLPLGRALDQGSTNRLKQSLEPTLAIDRVYGAYVYNQAGELVLAMGRQPEQRQPRIREIAVEGDGRGEYGQVAGRRTYSYFVPLSDVGGTVNGVLQVTRRRRDIDEYLSTLRGQAAVVLALGTGLMVGLVLWGHHHALGKHVQRLLRDMRRVERGERLHRATLEGPEEVSALAASLNSMLDSIGRSERKLARQRQTQATLEERLHQAEKLAAIGGLAAGVAHELGTPLSVVDGQAQRLLRDSMLPPAVVRAVQQVRDQVRRMDRIVRQLLDFGGSRPVQPRPAKAGEVVARACRDLEELAKTHRVTLTNHVEGQDLVLALDAARLESAVSNLVRNAIQAAPGGQVRVRTAAGADNLQIRVDDSGAGVPREIHGRIFEPFFTTKSVGQGTGLGLALAHRAIQDMGGTIGVASSDCGGARFEIRLPRAKSATQVAR